MEDYNSVLYLTDHYTGDPVPLSPLAFSHAMETDKLTTVYTLSGQKIAVRESAKEITDKFTKALTWWRIHFHERLR